MPSRFAFRGERLAFSAGIVALALLSIVVLVAFGGRVEALIPLYAIGVFTSITLSQAGMVVHWWRERGDGWRRSMAINGFGAVADGDRRDHLRGREVRPRRLADRDHHPAPGRRDAADRPPVPPPPARDRGPHREHHRPAEPPPAGHRPGVRRDPRRGPGDPFGADDVRRRHGGPRHRRPRGRRAPPRAVRAPAPGRAAGHRRVAVPLARSVRWSASSRTPPSSPATTWSSCCCPSTCRATGGSASCTTRTGGSSSGRCSAARTSWSPRSRIRRGRVGPRPVSRRGRSGGRRG